MNKIIKFLKGHYHKRIEDWETSGQSFGLDVHAKTVKRAMNRAGYHKCRACQKAWISEAQAELRYQYALEKLQWPEWQWKDVH